jgi:hypothetical protein
VAAAASTDELKALELARSRGVAITSAPAVGGGSSLAAPRAAPARERLPDAERAAALTRMMADGESTPLASPADAIPPSARASSQGVAPTPAPARPNTADQPARTQSSPGEDLVTGDSTSPPAGANEYATARRFLGGDSVDTEGLQWLHRAAQAGHAQAQFELGERYLAGQGVQPDEAMAITLLREAATHDHAAARSRLTAIYAEAGLPMPDLKPREVADATSAQPVPVAVQSERRESSGSATSSAKPAATTMPPAVVETTQRDARAATTVE